MREQGCCKLLYKGGTGILKIGKTLGVRTALVQRVVMEQPNRGSLKRRPWLASRAKAEARLRKEAAYHGGLISSVAASPKSLSTRQYGQHYRPDGSFSEGLRAFHRAAIALPFP
jgi:hypothetical protein